MTMYIDEELGLDDNQRGQLEDIQALFDIKCLEHPIGNSIMYEVQFIPIPDKYVVYYITIETIKSLTKFLEFKHLELSQNGFVKFVFKPYNSKIYKEIKELSFRNW